MTGYGGWARNPRVYGIDFEIGAEPIVSTNLGNHELV